MKKILNISVIAALAILPLAANANPVAGDPLNIATNPPTGQTAENVTAGAGPKYQLAEANADVDGVVATAGYVKGAYNAAIKAINKVSETANSAVKTVKVNGTPLTATEGAVDVLVEESANNGKIKVNNVDVAVHGLGSAAYTDSTAYASAAQGDKADTAVQTVKLNGSALTEDANGAVNVTAVQSVGTGTTNGTVAVDGTDVPVAGWASKQDALNENQLSAVNSGITSGKVSQYDTLVTNSADYATKTGAAETAKSAVNGAKIDFSQIQATTGSLSGTVAVVDTWGADAPSATPVSVSLSQNSVVTGLTGNVANVSGKISAGTVSYTASAGSNVQVDDNPSNVPSGGNIP